MAVSKPKHHQKHRSAVRGRITRLKAANPLPSPAPGHAPAGAGLHAVESSGFVAAEANAEPTREETSLQLAVLCVGVGWLLFIAVIAYFVAQMPEK